MYKTGLIIGRFQPFHKGHEYLMKQAFQHVPKAIIGIGSVNIHDSNNPYSLQDVLRMLAKAAEKGKWASKIIQTFGIPDFFNDEKWRSYIESHASPFDVVITNNDWVAGIYQDVGFPTIRIPFYRRELYEGIKIRDLMKRQENWNDRVPAYLVPLVKSITKQNTK